ncbi:MAG: acyl--CoA ligase [Planctomyces sp.]|nr:acyl--CoA ligase [Planctomyces sp.]
MALQGPPLNGPVDLVRLLEQGLRRRPADAALLLRDRRWTWSELDRAATRLAGRYLALGLSPGDRVASLMPNRGELLVHYLACFRAGLTATPLNYRYQAPEVDHALEVSGAALLVAHVERDDALAASRRVPELRLGRIACGGRSGAAPALEDLIGRDGPPPALPDVPPDTPAFLFFTSGSTGKPKGVTHTQATFGWILASAIAGLQLSPDDVFLPATSASHVAATSFLLAGLAAGARVAMARTFDGGELLPLLRDVRPTLLCMLPAPLFGLVRDHGASGPDFASIRRCVSGGDRVPAALEREFTDLTGQPIEELYGMTETGTSVMNPAASGNRIGSIGRLAPGYEASLRDEAGAEVPSGAPGRLWIRSPCNMIGYWNRPDATAETVVDGWLDTGDLVAADADGYLWFRGRKKQIIIHDGSNICPEEVEDSLLEHPAVASAGVIGVHDLVHGETVRAYVAFRPDREPPALPELIRFSRDRVGYKAPDEVVVLGEMPLNAVGKVDRLALAGMAEADANRHLSG